MEFINKKVILDSSFYLFKFEGVLLHEDSEYFYVCNEIFWEFCSFLNINLEGLITYNKFDKKLFNLYEINKEKNFDENFFRELSLYINDEAFIKENISISDDLITELYESIILMKNDPVETIDKKIKIHLSSRNDLSDNKRKLIIELINFLSNYDNQKYRFKILLNSDLKKIIN